jgi:predicted RNA-binding protein with PUA-like domain
MPPKKPSKPRTSKSAPKSASKASAKSRAKSGAKSGARPSAAATARGGPRFWLVKSEPSEFSFDALSAAPKRTAMWDGVRNYQARNTLRHEMAVGDEVLYYHSNSDPMGVVGVARVASAAYPDPTQFERGHVHEDPGSSPADPRWWVVDVQAVRRLPRVVTLDEMKANPALAGMPLLQRGSRLSVQPVGAKHFAEVLRMASSPA